MSARRRGRVAVAVAALALGLVADAEASGAAPTLSVAVDRTRIATALGHAFVFRSTITNTGPWSLHSAAPCDTQTSERTSDARKQSVRLGIPIGWTTSSSVSEPGLFARLLRKTGARSASAAYRKTIVEGLPVLTMWPVGVSLPLA